MYICLYLISRCRFLCQGHKGSWTIDQEKLTFLHYFPSIPYFTNDCLYHHYKIFLAFKGFYELASNYGHNPTSHSAPNSTRALTKSDPDCPSHISHSYLEIFTHYYFSGIDLPFLTNIFRSSLILQDPIHISSLPDSAS